MKKYDLPVLYLGCNVPSKDVRHLFRLKSPRYLYLHLTTFPRGQNLSKYLSQLAGDSPDIIVLVSGSIARAQSQVSLPNVRFFQTITEVIEFIKDASV